MALNLMSEFYDNIESPGLDLFFLLWELKKTQNKQWIKNGRMSTVLVFKQWDQDLYLAIVEVLISWYYPGETISACSTIGKCQKTIPQVGRNLFSEIG